MTLTQSPIGAENVNAATDLAKCIGCNAIFKASELIAYVDLLQNLEPPAGSKIVFNAATDECASFLVPARGLKGNDAFPLLFTTFWICFIAFWTWGAAQASLLTAAFSIPFWVVGLVVWKGIIIGATETQQIKIESDTLSVAKRSAVSSNRQTVPYAEVETIDIESFMPRDPFTMARHMRNFTRMSGMMGGIPLPTISHGTKKTHFGENVSKAEMKWIVRILKALVFKKIGKKV